jgi:hypothetical protein
VSEIKLEEGLNQYVALLKTRQTFLKKQFGLRVLNDFENLEFTGLNMYLADLDLGR